MSDQTNGLLSGYLRKTRIRTAMPYIQAPLLDIGCGDGPLAQFFKPEEYTGIDIDTESLSQARLKNPQHRFCSLENIPEKSSFSSIVLLASIEHIPQPKLFLQKIKGYLKNDGKIIITTPSPIFKNLYEAGSYLKIFSRQAAEEHENYYDLSAIKELSISVGLIIKKYQKFLFGANQLFILENTHAH